MQDKDCIYLNIGGGNNIIKPTLSLICQIEDEIAPIPKLLEDLKTGVWRISDIITIIHIMLAEQGNFYDYQELGNRLIKDGINIYHSQIISFLEICITGNNIPSNRAFSKVS